MLECAIRDGFEVNCWENFYCSVRFAWTVKFHGNSVLIGNRYEETVFSRVIYHMSRLCI